MYKKLILRLGFLHALNSNKVNHKESKEYQYTMNWVWIFWKPGQSKGDEIETCNGFWQNRSKSRGEWEPWIRVSNMVSVKF